MAKSKRPNRKRGSGLPAWPGAGKTTAAPPLSTAEQLARDNDRRLAAAALQARNEGRAPAAAELAGLRRFEQRDEEERRWRYYRTIPQKHWRLMSGRQTKVLNEQATLYGIPFGGPVIDLPAVARALHDFLALKARILAADGDPLLFGKSTPSLERYRKAAAELCEIKVAQARDQVIARNLLHSFMGRLGDLLRGKGEVLQRRFGPEALQVHNESMDDFDRMVEEFFNERATEPGGSDAAPNGTPEPAEA